MPDRKPRAAEPRASQSPANQPRTAEQIRRSRNRVLGLGLAAFVVLIFFISIAKMS
ncbi:hypothetical protein [Novosphingobium silvae]|jgi:hypothetical protein|uniref:hypothetical protein n=1 Tax=Novosphingobium silvae TaxID=2692619 RepID=UPI001926335A|nr:hypothetical protein [Novosphingobium silvae]